MHHRSTPSFIEPVERRLLLAVVPAGFTETLLASGLTSPVAIDVADDGRVFFVTQAGQVRIIQDDVLLPTPFANLTAQTDGSGERGMLGVTLAPDFATSRHVYVYYTANSPVSHNRLSRLTADPTDPNVMIPGSEVPILDLPSIGSAIWHMGGSIQFGPTDGKIYIAVGDHQQSTQAQSLGSVFGKILRVNPDGTIPADNPFYNTAPAGITQAIWALGLRNPYTTAFQPGTGRFFINDVGQDTWEEINDGAPGANYGWPTTEGDFNPATFPNFSRPFYAYQHVSAYDAITGGAFYNPQVNQFPAQYVGDYFFVDFSSGEMFSIDLGTKQVTSFATGTQWPTGMDVGSDGTLYYVSRGAGAGGQPGTGTGKIYKVQYVSNIPPTIAQQPQDRLVSVGYDATFTVSASGSAPLSYQWMRNGVDIPGATASSYTLVNAQLADHNAQFSARVTNAIGEVTSNAATLSVTTNLPPVAIITTPPDETTYRAGDVISYSGSATDEEDGSIPASNMTWWVDFHHDDHFHPFIPAQSGQASGGFQIPQTGEQSANVWYRIHFVVTDSIGLEHHVFRDVTPIVSTLTVTSNLPGIQFTLDGQPHATPFAVDGVAGLIRGLSVPTIQSVNGQWYEFTGWSDGGAATHNIVFPDADATLTATFAPLGGVVWVSDLPFAATPTNGWGPVERDRSVNGTAAGDGRVLTLNGVTYAKGLGVHAGNSLATPPEPPSRVTFHLGGAYSRFLSDVGLDDETSSTAASVIFQVFADGVKVYDSGVMRATTPTKSIDLNVDGVRVLELVCTDAGDGKNSDHGDWAGAMLLLRPGATAPVAHYEFDDAAGTTIRDFSSNANHGVASGTVNFVPGLIAKHALNFDGLTGIVTVPNKPQLNPSQSITVAAWVNATSWAGGARRIIQKGNANNQYALLSTGSQLQWNIAGVGTVNAPLPATGAWHHVAGTFENGVMRLYVDGVLAGTLSTGIMTLPTSADPLAIGGRNTGLASERFQGALDDARVYGRALAASEILTIARPININFQLAGAATPAGYLADTGALFADRGNGFSYGWNASHTDNARERNSASQPDQRLDTLNQLHPSGAWEIALPNGQYLVHLSVGDPSFSNYSPTLNIEGFNVYTNLAPMANNAFVFTARVVTVADGRLTIDQGGDGEKELRPNYIQIYALSSADTTPPTVTESAFVYAQPVEPGKAHGVTFTFSENVGAALENADLQLVNLTTGTTLLPFWIDDPVAYNGGTNTATFTFATGYAGGVLPNGNYRATLAAGSIVDGAGNALEQAYLFDFFVLNGDANHDRYVDAADQAILSANLGQAGGFADGDFNADGMVNAADQAYLTASWHVYLPAHGPWTLPASSANDSYRLRRESPSVLELFAGGDTSPTYRAMLGGVTSILFNGGAGDDTLILDHTNGNPIPAIPMSFNGGTGTGDALHVIGSAGADVATFNAASVVLGLTVAHSNIESRSFDGAGGGDTLTIAGGALSLAATQVLASLAIADGAQLDVRDHDIIVDYAPADPSPIGTFDGVAYDGLTGHIAAGRIVSSLLSDIHALGIGEIGSIYGLGPSDTFEYEGRTLDASTVLLKYSYVGDADLNGVIDGADYGRIDNWHQFAGTSGYANGDFNYDGLIDGADYGYIDNSVQLQGPPL